MNLISYIFPFVLFVFFCPIHLSPVCIFNFCFCGLSRSRSERQIKINKEGLCMRHRPVSLLVCLSLFLSLPDSQDGAPAVQGWNVGFRLSHRVRSRLQTRAREPEYRHDDTQAWEWRGFASGKLSVSACCSDPIVWICVFTTYYIQLSFCNLA